MITRYWNRHREHHDAPEVRIVVGERHRHRENYDAPKVCMILRERHRHQEHHDVQGSWARSGRGIMSCKNAILRIGSLGSSYQIVSGGLQKSKKVWCRMHYVDVLRFVGLQFDSGNLDVVSVMLNWERCQCVRILCYVAVLTCRKLASFDKQFWNMGGCLVEEMPHRHRHIVYIVVLYIVLSVDQGKTSMNASAWVDVRMSTLSSVTYELYQRRRKQVAVTSIFVKPVLSRCSA